MGEDFLKMSKCAWFIYLFIYVFMCHLESANPIFKAAPYSLIS